MRILGILALCLVIIAGLIFGYNRRNEVITNFTDQFEGVLLNETAIVDATVGQLPVSEPDQGRLVIPMRETGVLNTLIGLPSFTRATFDMPLTATARSGEIVLELAGALQADAEGLLRVSVNGARKTAQVLDAGRVHRRVIIALSPRDLSSDRLVVSLALEGRTPAIECGPDWDGGASIQVLPHSHLRLTLTDPMDDPADLLRVSGPRPTLTWTDTDQARRFIQAYDLSLRSDDVMFATDEAALLDVSPDRLDDILSATAPPIPDAETDPSDLITPLGQQRVREFEGETRWRVTFDRADFDTMIQSLDLSLKLVSVTDPDEPWLLAAELNDRLLTAAPFDLPTGQFTQSIPLPQSFLADENVLTLSLRSSSTNPGPCPTGIPAIAELTTLTLQAEGEKPQTAIAALAANLNTDISITVDDGIGPHEAQRALDTLNLLADHTGALALTTDAAPPVTARILARGGVSNALTSLDSGTHWLVFYSAGTSAVQVERATPNTPLSEIDLPRAVLLITTDQGS